MHHFYIDRAQLGPTVIRYRRQHHTLFVMNQISISCRSLTLRNKTPGLRAEVWTPLFDPTQNSAAHCMGFWRAEAEDPAGILPVVGGDDDAVDVVEVLRESA